MQQYDSDKAARVWQRVRGEGLAQPQDLPELPGLAAEESALAALYRQMARTHPECQSLARDCSRYAAVLRGICLFQERQPGKAAPEANIRSGLRLCCARTLRCIGAYEKLADHPEYGCVFRRLAEGKKDPVCKLLELAGTGK